VITSTRRENQVSKILLDVDGVVADTRNTIIDELQLNDPDPKSWDLVKILPPEDKEEAVALMNEMEFWGGLPLIDGAKKAVRLLKAYGHDIVWVTSPWKSCRGWDQARRFWISEHFGDDPVIIRSDKEEVDGDIFIDDKPENVEAWRKAHPNKKAFIYDQPYNRDYHGAQRFDWSKVESLL